jgi:hypothetical protein
MRGKKDVAQKQFALAAGLDLTAADKAELAKQSLHTRVRFPSTGPILS